MRSKVARLSSPRLKQHYFHLMQKIVFAFFVVLFLAQSTLSNAFQNPSNTDTLRTGTMPQIEVIGQIERFVRIPGSADLISRQQIQAIAPVSGHEVFRRISGLHVVEEEGVGLRANIGIRGLDPDKSRTVLMLEDGIPVALAPYGEPEMYYTPSMDRMAGVEILKGSGSILFGPQTFGGVINYITANPPAIPTATAHLRGGENGFLVARFGYGTTYGNTGFQTTYLHKRGDDVGLLTYNLHDLSTKIKMVLAENSIVGIKFGLYNETSNSTYIGLTQAMFDTGLYDFTHLAPDDNLSIRRYSASVAHDYYFSANLRLKTTLFGYTTTRNWTRQDFDNTFNATRMYPRVVGNPAEGNFNAIYFRNTTGNRNRQFEVLGIEPRLSANYTLAGMTAELDFGLRYLYERAFEQRVDGTYQQLTDGTWLRPTSGNLREDEIRTGRAFSAYLQNRLYLSQAFTITPGLRFEYFEYERDIFRRNNANVAFKNSSELSELIPGLGFNYKLGPQSSIFAGVHRGFGPPRTKDAITSGGVAEDLDAEKSWNYEIGTRMQLGNYVSGELATFFLDFSNQVIPVSESSGGAGAGASGLINGGETRHIGLESAIDIDFGRLFQLETGILFRTAATYTRATFSNDRLVDIGGGVRENVQGNTLPYAPEVIINTRLDVALPFGLGLGFDGTYISDQFGDARNTIGGSDDGRDGQISSHFVLNALLSYNIPSYSNARFSMAVKNLLDERYMVSRRPQGIRVGLPRFISAGIDFSF